MRMGYWGLSPDGKTAVYLGEDHEALMAWGKMFASREQRIVEQTEVKKDPRVWVSTVFLGMDHSWEENGPPILWETMIFGGILDLYQERYSSYIAAVRGHNEAVRKAKLGTKWYGWLWYRSDQRLERLYWWWRGKIWKVRRYFQQLRVRTK